MVYDPTNKKVYICVSRTNQDSVESAKLMLVQENPRLIVHESFIHASWSNIIFGTMSEIRNFFSVGSTQSLTFSDNTSLSKNKGFGFISRVEKTSSCLTDLPIIEQNLTLEDLLLNQVAFSTPNASADSTLEDFKTMYVINQGERETIDTYLDPDQVLERGGPCAPTTTIVSLSDPTIGGTSPIFVCQATGIVEIPFTLPSIKDPVCDDTENFWMPVLRPVSSTMTNKQLKVAVNIDPPVIRIEDLTTNNFGLLDESYEMEHILPSGDSKTLPFQLKGQANASSCSVTPPAQGEKWHNIMSTVSVDFLIDDFTVSGDCSIEKYETLITSDKDVSWLVPITQGVRVPVQTDIALIGDYTV